ncbi:hypothetical protein [Parafrankia sp. EUN1f]|uniref:hypothetical protein n=1 Tax=Parafrankia sp. EUN1f TaxID=102897 RepID=UPI0012FC537E|nr:hypothetical protein [Parafrankia sp. EUN1f]
MDLDVIHLLIAWAEIKAVQSHLSVKDLTMLVASGGRGAGPVPLPPAEPGAVLKADRTLRRSGTFGLGGKILLAAEVLGGFVAI